ncbi:MAG: general secretion pathway protein GspK [Gammaproteobacteria bacterium]|nr:general secretion pathway protein GspK [Gammaproteobacteria bacterium]
MTRDWNAAVGAEMGLRYERGVALVTVLWLLVLLSTIAGSYAYAVRTEYSVARNNLQAGKARVLAEAGLNRGIVERLLPPGADRWSIDGTAHRFRFGAGTITVRTQSATGLVDLNAAPPAMLGNILRAVGVAAERRDALVDAILDWRDGDDLRRLNGAEARDYRFADAGYLPANRPFEYPGELALVLGMQPQIYRRLRPFVTVYSRRAQVDRNLAPRTVLLALLDGNVDAVEEVLATRAERAASARQAGQVGAAGIYHVNVEATLDDGTTATLAAVVSINSEPEAPYSVLDWREGETSQRAEDA